MANDVTRRWPKSKVLDLKGRPVATHLYRGFTAAINKDDAASYGPGRYTMQGWTFDINPDDTITVRAIVGLTLSEHWRARS